MFGKQAEHLLHHFLQASPQYEVLAFGLQLIRAKITLGELDFILKDLENDEVFQLEMAIKFYLYQPGAGLKNYQLIGPNRKDSLDAKLAKLKEQQFKILHQPATHSLLLAKGFNPGAISQKLYLPGRIFIPLGSSLPSLPLINPASLGGYYLPLEAFAVTFNKQQSFYIPPKTEWLATPDDNTEWMTFDQAWQQLKVWQNHGKSPMIWVRKGNDFCGSYFITNWHNRH